MKHGQGEVNGMMMMIEFTSRSFSLVYLSFPWGKKKNITLAVAPLDDKNRR